MNKILSLCLSILLVLSFCACGNNSKPLDNNHPLIGAWDGGSEGGVWVFNKDFSFYVLSFDDGLLTSIHDGEKWTKHLQGTYSFDSDKQITLSTDGDNVFDIIVGDQASYDFMIKEADTSSMLSLTSKRFGNTITFDKVAYPHSSTLIGEWTLLGHSGDFSYFEDSSNSYVHTFTFYNDGTYRANLYFWYAGEANYDLDHSGNYELVHDGATISFDGKAFYGVEFFGDSIVFLTDPSGNTLVFAHQ